MLYPDFLYNPGRKKVLQQFLAMKPIYSTKHFSENTKWLPKGILKWSSVISFNKIFYFILLFLKIKDCNLAQL
jgi:hypothetical protein